MFSKTFTLAALASLASAQSLLDALSSQNASLSTLNSLLGAQPALVTTLGSLSNITVLAPSNDAFSTFLNSSVGAAAASNPDAVAALLTYHILNGTYFASAFTDTSTFVPTLLTNTTYTNVTGGQVVDLVLSADNATIYSGLLNNSTVTTANVNFTGGVIHIIDTVLTLPAPPSNTSLDLGLTALAGALTSANLVTAVDGLSDVTIFAPTNAAFQAIGSATGNLTTEELAGILEYHVINGTVGYSTALTDMTVTTLGGQNLTITVEDGNVFVGSAKVTIPNILVSNGVVHVIDNVLNPANTTAAPNPSETSSGSPAFSGASSASDVPFTTGVTATTTVPAASSTAAGSAGTPSASSAGAVMPTGAIGAAALFGAAGIFAVNL